MNKLGTALLTGSNFRMCTARHMTISRIQIFKLAGLFKNTSFYPEIITK